MLGLEFNVVVEFSELTKPQAALIAKRAKRFVEDAQPHCKRYDNPVVESEESKGRHYDVRRISFFVAATRSEVAVRTIDRICTEALSEGAKINCPPNGVTYSIVNAYQLKELAK